MRAHLGRSETADVGGLRLVACDTTQPGRDDGRLDLAWLAARLAESDAPTIVAMHHPPVPIGIPALDRIGLPGGGPRRPRRAARALAARVPRDRRSRPPHRLRASSAGAASSRARAPTGRRSWSSAREEFTFVDEPPAFAVHTAFGVAHPADQALTTGATAPLRTSSSAPQTSSVGQRGADPDHSALTSAVVTSSSPPCARQSVCPTTRTALHAEPGVRHPQRAQHVVGHLRARVAEHDGVAEREPERLQRIDAAVHAAQHGEPARRLSRQAAGRLAARATAAGRGAGTGAACASSRCVRPNGSQRNPIELLGVGRWRERRAARSRSAAAAGRPGSPRRGSRRRRRAGRAGRSPARRGARAGSSGGSPAIRRRIRLRSWSAKCGVELPMSWRTSSTVT